MVGSLVADDDTRHDHPDRAGNRHNNGVGGLNPRGGLAVNYFIDTEFIEDGRTIDLISIGIVGDDGREFYAISTEFDEGRASDWVRAEVLAKLPSRADPAWKLRGQIRDEIVDFIHGQKDVYKPTFWGYYADYDWVVFCWLFGSMIDLPKYFPMYCRDLKQELDSRGNPPIPFLSPAEHHALEDARWNKRVYDWLFGLRGLQPQTPQRR
jgi:hypothetical protein